MNAPKRRRAKTPEGHFIADDPSTPQNEAWEDVPDGQPTNEENAETATFAADVAASEAAQVAGQKAGHTTYVTKQPETGTFDIMVAGELIRGSWDNKRERVIFRVPEQLAARFEMHTMYLEGRIIKA